MRLAGCLAIVLMLMATSGSAFAVGWIRFNTYAVKPSDVAIPDGEELGKYRRVVQPFKNWILICDESLTSKRRVCNLTQSIVNQDGSAVFNWSFVATADGQPLVVMRVPAAVGVGQQIGLALGDKPDRIVAQTDRCDGTFCTATIAIGRMLRRHIQAGTDCTVSYQLPEGEVSFEAPLDGLFLALSAMK
ncbi:invasion protein IalB [Inquilinus ginsengisoli]|uniref:Invasion protein IalB n=1 Tax=Inquilinus ginsengisoli TaxID=363840 RepID=A0ABU1JRZ9_9PROT|nr:invasion associated locus B family protein [Inquilinus ginsengisoli]MDR6290355.1 invasion protein IalB [Inquilinus ginsengisoli]